MRATQSHHAGRDAGFSLIELMVALSLLGIIGGMAVVSVQGALTTARGDTAAHQVASVLRLGRDTAIAQRRRVDVVFVQPNRVQLVRNNLPNGTTLITDVALENGAIFQLDPSLPEAEPGFGRSAAIDFANAAVVRFMPDGTLSDGASVPINGTVYLGMPGQKLGARAVTVTGTTARSQPYRWTGSRWEAL